MSLQCFKISSFFSKSSPYLNQQKPNPSRAAAKNPPSPSPKKNATTKEVLTDLSPFIKVYADGTVERLLGTPYVPPSPEDPDTGVASKDVTISPSISARIYLPKLQQKLPILVYYHAGDFCLDSAFSLLQHRYVNFLAAGSGALVVAVEFRRAPEHPLPAAYEDCWNALKWICLHAVDLISHEASSSTREEWIVNHGDFSRVFIGGDSSGGNIAHNIAMRAGSDPLPGNLKIKGAVISHPYFWGSNPVVSHPYFSGSNPIGNEAKEDREQSLMYRIWLFVYPDSPGGIDNPLINPFVDGAPSLSGLGCSKILVCLSEKDGLRDLGKVYAEEVKKSGWGGEVEVVEVEGEGHGFHIFSPGSEKAISLFKKIADFLS